MANNNPKAESVKQAQCPSTANADSGECDEEAA